MDTEQLMEIAEKYRKRAYVPVSGFSVGAALLCESGKVYGGCNIENSALSPGICAERTAFAKAISEGEKKFCKIAVAGGPEYREAAETPCPPCGVCRQMMAEFCDGSFQVVMKDGAGGYRIGTLDGLLPERFGLEHLK